MTKQQQKDDARKAAKADPAYKAYLAILESDAYKAKPEAQPDEVADIITYKGREYKLIESEES